MSAAMIYRQLLTMYCSVVQLMRSILLACIVVVAVALTVAQSGTEALKQATQPLPRVPMTVDQAVVVLRTEWLSPKDLDVILRNPQKDVVYGLYFPFGTRVRNEFRLWGDNQELRDSCGDNNPEGCSVVIFNSLWESVRADADPSLVRQLDCQFQLAEAIRINYKGFYKLTTGELLKAIQSQINDQMAKFAASGAPACQNSLTLEAEGKPDMHCFVDASFAEQRKSQPKDQPTETTLETILGWLGVRNFFVTAHAPPKITLNFTRKCQFHSPPYLY
jgi:hypothetical protein